MALDRVMCSYPEMQALKQKFDDEADDLNQTATSMQTFQNDTVSTAITSFKTKISEFRSQIDQTEQDIKTETARVCGDGTNGEGWIGNQSVNFVDSVEHDLTNCFNTLRQDMDEINNQFTELESKIESVIQSLKSNVEKVSVFCTENADFSESFREAMLNIDHAK